MNMSQFSMHQGKLCSVEHHIAASLGLPLAGVDISVEVLIRSRTAPQLYSTNYCNYSASGIKFAAPVE